MKELIFNVFPAEEGGFYAKAVGEGIATQGDTWEELRDMVLDATRLYFAEGSAPTQVRLHLFRDETLAVA